jgi:hypothetical protein
MPPRLRLAPRLVRAITILCARRIRFVLVGDAAARLHGAPVEAQSVEIVVGEDPHDPARLKKAFRQDWMRRIVRTTPGPYAELWQRGEEIPWVPETLEPRRVLNSWIGLPTGAIASLEDQLDARRPGYRIYRRGYE